jgi:thioredoxin reductase
MAGAERGRRLAVLGAGPVGLECAAAGLQRGYDVVLLEAGEVAQHMADWGHVRLFTPFGMNAGPAGLRLLSRRPLPGPEHDLTGAELREAYLLPLAEALAGRARLETGARVLSVTRSHHLKGDALGRPERAADPFRILLERDGAEAAIEADAVLDCTGTFGRPNRLGPGGAPALGERALEHRIDRRPPDLAAADRPRYQGSRTLLVGSGHSAATAAVGLAALAAQDPATSFLWITRGDGPAVEEVPGDSLAARASLVRSANAVAAAPPPGSEWRADMLVAELRPAGDGVDVVLVGRGGERVERVERVLGLVGYEPDDSLYRQLQIHECYASRGPMALSAALLAAAGEAADCLALGGFGPETLRNPEPNYLILGAKSYGRNSAFLLRTGYEQVEDAFSLLDAARFAAEAPTPAPSSASNVPVTRNDRSPAPSSS